LRTSINAIALLSNRVGQALGSFAISIGIARFAGAAALGDFATALTAYWIGVVLSSQGLKNLLVREVRASGGEVGQGSASRWRDHYNSGSYLVAAISAPVYLAIALVVLLLPYDMEAKQRIWLYAIAIVPFGLSNVTEAIFQAQGRLHWVALTTVPIYLIRTLLAVLLLWLHWSVDWTIGLLVLSEWIVLVWQWAILGIPNVVKLNAKTHAATVKQLGQFWQLEGIVVVSQRLEIILLSLLGGPVVTGLFSATTQLLQPVVIFSDALCQAVYPRMVDNPGTAMPQLRRVLAAICVPAFVAIAVGGQGLLTAIYGETFAPAYPALLILAGSYLFYPVFRPLCFRNMAGDRLDENLRASILAAISTAVAAPFAIAGLGPLGAALNFVIRNGMETMGLLAPSQLKAIQLKSTTVFDRPKTIANRIREGLSVAVGADRR
jgi:O-antigen/teichoic acid export membrane protein